MASYGERQPSRILDPHVVGMSTAVKTSLSASGTPASGEGSRSPAATASSTTAAAASASVGRHVQESVVAVVGRLDLIQARLGDLDRRHLFGGDPGGQRGGLGPDDLVPLAVPQDLRDGEAAVDRGGRLGQRLGLGQARCRLVRACDVDVLERVVGGFDAGDIDGLDLVERRVKMASS